MSSGSWRTPLHSNERGQSRGSRGRSSWSSRGRGSSSLRNTESRRLENIASVSRSSGLDKDGDALKDFKTQQEYRSFIQGKMETFWSRPQKPEHINNQETRDIQENLLILLRKLREGIVSSQRNDDFAVEVYETSLYSATLFDSERQLGSILPYFLSHPHESPHSLPTRPRSLCSIYIALLHQLIIGYPSQSSYRQSILSVSGYLLKKSPEAYRWISSLSSSLWAHNFSKAEKLTQKSSFALFWADTSLSAEFRGLSISSNTPLNHDLAQKALFHVIGALRTKVRNSAWNIIRSSYRELACNADSGTRDWLIRSLALTEVYSGDTYDVSLDDWLEEKKAAGHIRPKEGIEGRWIVCKVKS